MIKKFDVITKLYEEATQEVTESPEKWLAFLQSASKNYRLPFDEQLLIHVQRPEAVSYTHLHWGGLMQIIFRLRWIHR